jgi:threonylcarbamoyladenosine tRNA methylthiotransferase MtaB
MPLRVAFFTLGCKLNQLETESFADAFARVGATVLAFDVEHSPLAGAPPADLVVINTCTVTGKADHKARRMIRLALSANPLACALVTGCYAQVAAKEIAALDERVLVLPGQAKEALLGLAEWLAAKTESGELSALIREWLAPIVAPAAISPLQAQTGRGQASFAFKPESFSFHSRPSLKIQDGCDNSCAYCLVRVARGRSQSLGADELLARARALEERGKAEIVLTGVNLSQYRDGSVDFPALLELLVAGTSRVAFRLSSYEPDRIDASFLEAFSQPRVRPHVHLAIQSGSRRVLEAMGRAYGQEEILGAVEALRRVRRDPFIAADFISGFPGETEVEAEESIELARSCDLAWIHSFRFSSRPGTKAASMPGRVTENVISLRALALSKLGKSGKAAYIKRWIGLQAAAVLELGLGATADNYLRLKLRGLPEAAHPGQGIICRIEGDGGGTGAGNSDGYAQFIAFH